MRRGFQTRAERATRSVRRFGRRIRPTNIKRVVQSKVGRIGKNIQKIKNIKPLERLKNIMPKGKSGHGLFSRMKS